MNVSRASPLAQAAQNAGVAVLLVAVGIISHKPDGAPWALHDMFWPVTGLAFGLILRFGLRLAPGVLAGVCATAWLHAHHHGWTYPWPLAAIAPVLVLALRPYLGAADAFERLSDLARFIALVSVPCLVQELTTVPFLGWENARGSATDRIEFLAGELVGVLTITPILVNAFRVPRPGNPQRRQASFLLLLGGCALIALEARFTPVRIGDDLPLVLLTFPFALGLALVNGIVWACLAVALSIAVISLSSAIGPDANIASASLLTLQGYWFILAVSSLAFGTLDRSRRLSRDLADASMKSARIAHWTRGRDGRIRIADPAWQAFLGVPPEGFTVDDLRARLHPDDPLPCAFTEAGTNPDSPGDTFRIRGGDGGWLTLRCRSLPLVGERSTAGEQRHGFVQDLSDVVRAEALKREVAARDAQLVNLKLRLHPHFFFNALNTIRSLIVSNPEGARTVASDLSALLRNSLSDAEEDVVTLGRELEVTSAYLRVEQARYGRRLRASIDVPEALHREAFPPLLLQTLVENAVKYGVAKRSDGGAVTVSAVEDGAVLVVTVSNDGPLVPLRKASHDGTGTALQRADQRVKLLFGPDASVTIREEGAHPAERVVAEVRFPRRRSRAKADPTTPSHPGTPAPSAGSSGSSSHT